MSLRPLPEAHRTMLLRLVRVALADLREKIDARKRCETRPMLRIVRERDE